MSSSSYNVLFLLRSDAGIKPGGDLVQARFYQKVLEEKNSCKVFFSHDLTMREIREISWDLVQVFNISRLHENMALLRGVEFRSLLLTPIMQPGFSFGSKLVVKNFIRGLLWGRASLQYLRSPSELLNQFDGFVFLSDAERSAFFASFPAYSASDNAIYQNGVADGLAADGHPRFFDFMVAGRIEPKKRVVEAVEAVAKAAPKSILVCVGGINWYHPIYCLKFFLQVLKGNVVYLGRRDPSVVYDFMRRAKVLLNFSELEVSPLVDLEALACGCYVVSTIYSYSHLPDGERYVRIDVKDISQCFVAIRKSLESDGNIFMKINTWAENSGAYHGLVNRMFKANKNDGVDE
ncbi:glycosyltransferase [Pseudomonas flexibilis]|uniref:glycosyltransferase n=1 Tax=Pseudomonas flexibilis TaxID=706570 RepID=UPI000876B96D|nr:glycosyltransferase [Pseudomonas flexibilis]SCY47656.1 Glycosyl transferases group 1 [Pseudomonas flexibilis]